MMFPTYTWCPQYFAIVLPLFYITFSSPIQAITSSSNSNQLEIGIKCGSCPCGNPCSEKLSPPPPETPPPLSLPLPGYSSPPPLLLSPPPPPPSPPPPPPPSRPPPTPPPPRFIYVSGSPGDVYYYNDYSASQSRGVEWLVLASLGAMLVTMIFG